MLSTDEVLMLRESVDNNITVLINKIVELFDTIEYIVYQDELEEIINGQQDKNVLKENIYNLFTFHIYRVGLMLGIEFSNDSSLQDRYFILKAITNIPNLEPVLLEEYVDFLSIDESNLEKIELVLDNVLEKDLDVYDNVDSVTDELIDTLKVIMSSDTHNIDALTEVIMYKKNKQYIEVLGKEPISYIVHFIKNNKQIVTMELLILLFKDKLNISDINTLENIITTMIVFSNTDKQEYVETYITYFSPDISQSIVQALDERITKIFNQF